MVKQFVWDPASNQMYGEDDEEQTISQDDFSKDLGKNFTMNGGSLTLQKKEPKSGSTEWLWGRSAQSDSDGIRSSRFQFTDDSFFQVVGNEGIAFVLQDRPGDRVSGAELFITLEDDAQFKTRHIGQMNSNNERGLVTRLTFSGRSLCAFENAYNSSLQFDLAIEDEAAFKVNAFYDAEFSHTTGHIDAGGSSKDLFNLLLESGGHIKFKQNNHLNFSNGSQARILTKKLIFELDNNQISASNLATVTLEFDQAEFNKNISTAPFKVKEGTPKIVFNSPSIDFLKGLNPFPKGSLFFDTSSGNNHGQFVLKGIGNAFEFNAMINEGIVSIDGNTDPDYVYASLKPYHWGDADLSIELGPGFKRK